MLPVLVPGYSLGPAMGLAVNTLLLMACLLLHWFNPRLKILSSLGLFYLALAGFFLGYLVYALQLSSNTILLGYGLMLASVVWMPFTWSWVAAHLGGRRPGPFFTVTLAAAISLSLLLLLWRTPAVLSLPLEASGHPGVLRPSSWLVKPLIYYYGMTLGVLYFYSMYFRWWPGPKRPVFLRPLTVGVAMMVAGGIVDALTSLGLPGLLPFKVFWLCSMGMSLCAALSVALHLRGVESALVRSEEKHRTILQDMEEGYYEVDLRGNLTFFNQALCRITGYTPEELTGLNNRAYMSPQASAEVSQTFRRVYQTGEAAAALDWELWRKDGSRRIIEVSISLVKGARGKATGFRGIARDVTEQKRAQEEIVRRSEQLRELAVQLSRTEERERRRLAQDLHDGVGQYLAVCKLKLTRLMDKGGEAVLKPLSVLLGLLEQAIADTRSLTSRLSPRVLDEIGLEAALSGLAEETTRLHGLKAEYVRQGDPPVLDQETRAFLYRAAGELLHNVAKHAGALRVRLELAQEDGAVRLSVEDDGRGLDPEQALRPRSGGLGLFSIQQRAEHMGGRLSLESGRPGARLVLTLPLTPGAETKP
ncbi:MAG: PAS domain S-box protein [Desulfarculaceae bacterium]|nr:PAS domain S-box protein [Desulfarculaceae bacterium]